MMQVVTEKVVYCYMAQCRKWVRNSFTCDRFFTGNVIDGQLEELGPLDLKQGDVIHFLPITSAKVPYAPLLGQSIIAVVHGVMPNRTVILANIHMTKGQLKALSDAHVSGKI